MGFGTIYGKTSEMKLVSCYCSNTAEAAIRQGNVVALRFTDTTYSGDGDVMPELGNGFGAAIDYAVSTNSVVVGVVAPAKHGETSYEHQQWAPVVTRGPLASVCCSQTFTGKLIVFPSVVAANVGSVASDDEGDGKFPYGVVGYGLTGSTGEGTDTISMFVTTLFGG